MSHIEQKCLVSFALYVNIIISRVRPVNFTYNSIISFDYRYHYIQCNLMLQALWGFICKKNELTEQASRPYVN